MDALSKLRRKSTVVMLSYAPAGLGHLRVTKALSHGLPADISPVLLGADNRSITAIHRVLSVIPWVRSVMEWVQRGRPEDIFTFCYRSLLHSDSETLEKQMRVELEQRLEVPKVLVFVATHFGLAHQLSIVKKKFTEETGVGIFLSVVVTDDSPQHIWYVPGADVIFTPSESTSAALSAYGNSAGLESVPIVTVPYPVNTELAEESDALYENRMRQAGDSTGPVHIAVPVPGAVVGMDYAGAVIEALRRISDRFVFHIITKSSPATRQFIASMRSHSGIYVSSSEHDRDVVDLYDSVYRQNVIFAEITKPSEQAFKALFTPRSSGGSILLFSQPVGRQEWDNLAYLTRHQLLPDDTVMRRLHRLARKNQSLEKGAYEDLYASSDSWRALCLPGDPVEAARFIEWCLREHVFLRMISYARHPYAAACDREVATNGVEKIWEYIANHLE